MTRLVLFFVIALSCTVGYADIVTSFNAYLHTGNQSQVAFQNTSPDGVDLVSFELQWNENAVLGTPGKLLNPGLYGTSTEVTSAGLSSLLDAGTFGQTIRFTFSDMTSGNGFGTKVPISGISGSLIDGTVLVATFKSGAEYKELRYVFENTPGQGVSYNVSASSVPEPSTVGILLALLPLFTLVRIR
jgi:hypothetical protein